MRHHEITRRGMLQAAAGLGLAAGLGVAPGRAAEAVPFSAGTELPKLKVPPHSCDCHHHIYDPRFAYLPNAALKPPPATVADYRLLQKRLGTTRNVVVTPSTYGIDNSCTLDAIRQLGPDARGVAVVDTSVTDAELKRLDAGGIRGIRFNISRGAAASIEMIEPLSRRIAPLGWHIQVHMAGADLPGIADVLNKVASPIVFDHLGRVPEPAGRDHPAFAVIARLIERGRTWVKLSEADRDSKSGPPRYEDTARLVAAYIALAPERLVWGSDWPHPAATAGELALQDDAALLDLMLDWAPSEALRRRILVDNPAALYGFPAA
ncbi:MAG: amidohydrolase family protein [Rhodoplanes sp.]|uniref:amidohydrolase family protein n=1 Tax=Rhodoplanes sp. TaxID=1968906 RepID=UPI0018319E1A|nr:amidohydrolase family protein [Rhodoplanes sp.]NVO14408.1 amidohydrolase family protein [Rhodoplanes sp.]